MNARSWFRLLAAAYAVATAAALLVLPERVPVHFGPGGEPDRVVTRVRAVAELLAAGALLIAVLAGTAAAVSRLPMSMINVPDKEYWSRPENEPRLRAMVSTDLHVIGALTLAFLLGLLLQVVVVARQPEPTLGHAFWWLLVGYLLALTGYLGFVLTRRYRRGPR